MAFTPKFPWFPNVEIFIPRNKIFKHIQQSIPYCKGRLLDLGCGLMPYRQYIQEHSSIEQYIGMDLEQSEVYQTIVPDMYWDGYHIPLADNSIDTILLTEVLEHCPEPLVILEEAKRVLKPCGKIILSVPFIWYLHESPWDFYRYTPFAIKRMLEKTELGIDYVKTYGSNDLSFLHCYLIWLKKGSLPKFIRFGIYLLSLPFILFALFISSKKDRQEHKDGQFFIGTLGMAFKK